MNCEIICVGTELVLGDIVNTDAQYLSRQLAALGINVFFQTSVGDNPTRLREVLSQAVDRSDVIIFTGGLGPTEDDLTKKTICSAIGYELKLHQPSADAIREFYRRSGKPMPENNLQQAMFPADAVIFPNRYGTAPGCALSKNGQHIIMLPGPPRELQPMFEESVAPYLMKYSDGVIFSMVVNIYGMGESAVAEKLADLMRQANPTVAPYAKDGEVQLRVTAKAADQEQARSMCLPVVQEIRARLGTCVYAVDKENLQQVVVALLREQGKKVATAESCTAGLLSKRITDVPGSSSVFEMGVSAYSNDVKEDLLGIESTIIEQYGAVSPQTAAEMARAVRKLSKADIGMGITGIAGPGNDGTDKPVGLVYIALSDGADTYVIQSPQPFSGADRDYIRYIASSAALNLIRLYLTEKKPLDPAILPGYVEMNRSSPNPSGAAAAGLSAALTGRDISSSSLRNGAFRWDGTVSKLQPEEEVRDAEELLRDGHEAQLGDELASTRIIDFSSPSQEDGVELMSVRLGEAALSSGTAAAQDISSKKKESLPKRMLHYFFPVKGDSGFEITRKIILLAAIVALIVAGVILGKYFLDTFSADRQYKQLASGYHEGSESIVRPYSSPIPNPKFDELYAQNSDLIGWLTVPGTKTDNPVVQGDDDDYYLNHLFDKSQNRYGTIFLDASASIEYGNQTQNLVLYGHNMRDGTMMGRLTQYKNLDFYKENPTLTFDTLYNDGDWKIFAAFITNSRKQEDDGVVFYYRRSSFDSDEDFMGWIEQCKIRSIIDMPVDVQPGDEIVTLSTCAYDFDEARFVVMARKVRYDESESATVDVTKAKLNPNPVYPQAWYENHKGAKPDLGVLNPKYYEPGSDVLEYTQPTTTLPTTSPKTTEPGSATAPSTTTATQATTRAPSSPPTTTKPTQPTTTRPTTPSTTAPKPTEPPTTRPPSPTTATTVPQSTKPPTAQPTDPPSEAPAANATQAQE